MGAATPDLDTAISAVVAEMVKLDPLPGTVLHYTYPIDRLTEFLERFQDPENGYLELWLVDVPDTPADKQKARGENYQIYQIRMRYLSTHPDDEQWSRHAVNQGKRMVDQLTENANIFEIGGQKPLLGTPENVSMTSGWQPIGGQEIFQVELRLSVEARRWS